MDEEASDAQNELADFELKRLDLKDRLELYPLEDLIQGPSLAPPYLFSGFLRRNSLTMISAEPFVGKTMLLLHLALCLDMGQPVLGLWPVLKTERCLILGQDAVTWDYQMQIQKLYRGMGGIRETSPELKSFTRLNKGLNMMNPAFETELKEITQTWNISVVMMDTLRSFHGLDENSNNEMNAVMDKLKRWRDQLGLTILFTHHDAKQVFGIRQSRIYRPRGASIVSGSVDQHISLFTLRDQRSVALIMPKGRGVDGLEDVSFTIEQGLTLEEQPFVKLVTGASYFEPILEFLKEPRNRKDLVGWMKGREPGLHDAQAYYRVSNALMPLKRMGRIENRSRGVWQTKGIGNGAVSDQPQRTA